MAIILTQGQAGTTLLETITAVPHYNNLYQWTIAKSVSPEVLNLFRNDTGSVQYTITVSNDNGTIQAFIDGFVCITNGGAIETLGLASNLIVEIPIGTTVLSQPLDVSPNPILTPGQTYCYPYSIDISSVFVAGSSFRVTAETTILNHSGHIGEPFGPNEKASGTLPSTATDINKAINVTDTNGQSFVFNALSPAGSQFQTYTLDYSCNSGQGPHTNTATIVQTGQAASAAVIVNCYDLFVTKTTKPSFTRTYFWTITKKAVNGSGTEVSSLRLGLNESITLSYIVGVSPTYTDSNFAVSGTITVQNPNPTASANVLVSDLILPDNIVATVTPSSVVVPPSSSVTVDYSAVLPNNSSRFDQATALLYNVPSGTTLFMSDAVPFDFSNATIIEVDPCVNVSDSFGGNLGTACRSFTEFSYTRTFGPYTSCVSGTIQFQNIATFTTSDTLTTGSSSWTVTVTVPCNGCTLTIGYWKNHAGFGPQPDVVTPLLPINLGLIGGSLTVTVLTAEQAVTILNFGGSNGVINASNGINKLYAQLLAAKLNIKNGAEGSAVSSTISDADAFLATHDSLSWNTLTRAQRNQVNSWTTTLDNYNNGIIGPGHCTEESNNSLAGILTTTDSPTSDCQDCADLNPELTLVKHCCCTEWRQPWMHKSTYYNR